MNGPDIIRELRTRSVQYLSDYSLVLSHPKTFNDHRAADIGSSIARANFFLAISLALAIALSALLSPPELFHWKLLAGQVILDLIAIVLGTLAMRACWFVVGGRAPLKSLFLVYAYHVGVVLVWSIILVWVSDIIIRVFDPALYAEIHDFDAVEITLDETESPAYLGSMSILAAGHIGIFAWWIVAWGAYRKLNRLSRTRSVIAFLLAAVLSVVIALAIVIILSVLLSLEYYY